MSYSSSLGKILVVDDDENVAELLHVNLGSEGYTVDIIPVAENVRPEELDGTNLVIVDAMNQAYTGMDLIYDLKDNPSTSGIGIILYSPSRSERIVIDALDAGADDYITKPFSLRELVARVKSVMRRHSARRARPAGTVLTFMNMSLDTATAVVKIGDEPVSLSKTEYAILVILMKNINTYVSRVEIHKAVWNDGDNERIVDTNISRLRKKLGDLGEYLVNRSGLGYMLWTRSN